MENPLTSHQDVGETTTGFSFETLQQTLQRIIDQACESISQFESRMTIFDWWCLAATIPLFIILRASVAGILNWMKDKPIQRRYSFSTEYSTVWPDSDKQVENIKDHLEDQFKQKRTAKSIRSERSRSVSPEVFDISANTDRSSDTSKEKNQKKEKNLPKVKPKQPSRDLGISPPPDPPKQLTTRYGRVVKPAGSRTPVVGQYVETTVRQSVASKKKPSRDADVENKA